jgi:hypothetical protein
MQARCIACAALSAALVWWPHPAAAQAADQTQVLQQQIEQLRKDFSERIAALEAQLAAVQAAAAAQAAAPPPGPSGAGLSNSKVFNPDIAMIGNFLGASGKNLVNPSPAMELAESELSLQAVVDPYARADFFLSFGEQGVGVEEGFLTFNELPGKLLVRVGKMRAAFGKVNTMHTHALSWADRPLVTGNLLAGDDGINDAGLSVARPSSRRAGGATSATSGICGPTRT